MSAQDIDSLPVSDDKDQVDHDSGFIAGLLRRPVAVSMLSLSLLIIGALAYLRIPLQLMPSGYTMPLLYVQVSWPNATPQEALRQIMEPLEAAVATVPGVKNLHGHCRLSGVGLRIEFDEGTDMDEGYNSLRERLDRLRPDLPEGVKQIYVWKFDPDDEPVLILGIQAPSSIQDPYQRIDENLARVIDRIPGVGKVEIWGGAPRVALVEIDADLARARGLEPFGIAQTLRHAGFVLSAGLTQQGEQVFPVRVVQPLDNLQQLRQVPLGQDIILGDIAQVRLDSVDNEGSITTIDANPGLMLGVYKDTQANTVETCARVQQQVVAAINQDSSLRGFSTLTLFDQGALINESMHNLLSSLLYGGAIAAFILFAFLRRLRPTMTAALAIPVSLLGALAVLYFTGHSLNLLSLMGLMLSVGMVVDNAIVVVERVELQRQRGLLPMAAAQRGSQEVALAITIATATTVAAFLPIILMSGSQELSFFLGEVGMPVSYALLTSLLVAVVIVPWLTRMGARAPDPLKTPRRASRLTAVLDKMVARTMGFYLRTLTHSIASPLATILISLLLFSSIFFLNVASTEGLQAGSDTINVFFRPPPRFSVDQRQKVLRQAAANIHDRAQQLGVEHVVTRLRFNRGRDSLELYLVPPELRPIAKEDVAEKIKIIISPPPGVDWRVGWGQMGGGEANTLRLSLSGDDSQYMSELAQQIVTKMQNIPGVISVDTDVEGNSVRELRATLNPEQAWQRGVGPSTLGGSLSLALSGWRVGTLHQAQGTTDILVRVSESSKRGSHGIGQLALPTTAVNTQTLSTHDFTQTENLDPQILDQDNSQNLGLAEQTTAIDQVAVFHEAPGFGVIDRDQRKSIVDIILTLKDDDLIKLRKKIDARLDDISLPRGYQLSYGKRMDRLQEQEGDEIYAAALAITFVFLLMGILFESWLLPLAVITSVPFAYTGAQWLLALTGQKRDVMAMVGMVILIGVVVNNAIVFVDAINRARRQGDDRQHAILRAGRERMRPILMTALTTIGGLLPLALGTAQVAGVSYRPLAITVMGGLIAATAVTLFLVPSSYVLFDELAKILSAAGQNRRGPRQASPATTQGDIQNTDMTDT